MDLVHVNPSMLPLRQYLEVAQAGPSQPQHVSTATVSGADNSTAECTFCYGEYGEDDQEWAKCACGRWIHEMCMEDLYVDAQGQERF